MDSLDWILYLIIALFVAWEGIAHWMLHNHEGHTLSNRILWVETHDPTKWVARWVVAAAVVLLGFHLEGAF